MHWLDRAVYINPCVISDKRLALINSWCWHHWSVLAGRVLVPTVGTNIYGVLKLIPRSKWKNLFLILQDNPSKWRAPSIRKIFMLNIRCGYIAQILISQLVWTSLGWYVQNFSHALNWHWKKYTKVCGDTFHQISLRFNLWNYSLFIFINKKSGIFITPDSHPNSRLSWSGKEGNVMTQWKPAQFILLEKWSYISIFLSTSSFCSEVILKTPLNGRGYFVSAHGVFAR